MPQTIRIKRSSSAAVPTSLAPGEFAWSEASKILYLGQIAGGVLQVGGDRTLNFTGDATGTGTSNIALSLANSGVSAGIHTKVTVDAKGRVTAGTTLAVADIPVLTTAKISDFDAAVRAYKLTDLASPIAPLSLNGQRINNLGTPTGGTDAATKSYVDSLVQGLDPKASARAASTVNINIASPATSIVDGVSLSSGVDRLLLKNQTVASENGIYRFNGIGSPLTRTADFVNGTATAGAYLFIEEGTVNARTGWMLITPNPINIDTTALTFTQQSGAGSILAAAPLTIAGNQVSLQFLTGALKTNGSGFLMVAGGTAGQALISNGAASEATFGAVSLSAGVSGVLPVANGGTGVNSLPNGLLKSNPGGTAVMSAVADVDYLTPSSTIDGGTY